MQTAEFTLQVLFEDPFWVGIFERREGGLLWVSKITFGREPRDFEVYELVLHQLHRLTFSPPVKEKVRPTHQNPKRVQREARRQTQPTGLGTKSQQALQLQREQQKTLRREQTKAQREQQAQRRFELRRLKRLDKHRGR